MQVHAQEQRTAADAAAQQAAAQQVIPGDVSSLATLQLPESELPPGIPTLNLTKLTPLLPLLAGLNATVVASWLPVVERTPPESLALAVPALNALNASTLEGLVAALPLLNWETILVVLPLVNALPASTLTAYLNLLQDVSLTEASGHIPVHHCPSHGAARHPPCTSFVRLLAMQWQRCIGVCQLHCQDWLQEAANKLLSCDCSANHGRDFCSLCCLSAVHL